jgi:surface protein
VELPSVTAQVTLSGLTEATFDETAQTAFMDAVRTAAALAAGYSENFITVIILGFDNTVPTVDGRRRQLLVPTSGLDVVFSTTFEGALVANSFAELQTLVAQSQLGAITFIATLESTTGIATVFPVLTFGDAILVGKPVTSSEVAEIEANFPLPAAPAPPTNVQNVGTDIIHWAGSWTAAEESRPLTYSTKCVDAGDSKGCFGTSRGVGQSQLTTLTGQVLGLTPGTAYDCFAISVLVGDDLAKCSAPVRYTTECNPQPNCLASGPDCSTVLGFTDQLICIAAEPGFYLDNGIATACTAECSGREFVDKSACDGTTATNEAVCAECSASCSSGEFVDKSACDGTTETNGATCSACTADCSGGEFVDKSACDGTTETNGAACSACTAECSGGEFVDKSACDGTTATNEAVCAECSASCSSGEFVDKSACDGTTETNGAACSACTAECSGGEFVDKSACDGTTETNGAACSACTAECSGGEFVDKSACDGTTATNEAVCAECSASCSSGEFVDKSACDGTTETNGAACSACTAECSGGEFVDKSACDGTTATNEAVCAECSASCSSGEFVDKSACDGTTETNGATCSACTADCSGGEFVDKSACDGTTETNGAACSACTAECSGGEFVDKSACDGTTATNEAVCTECSASCSGGEFVDKSACDGTTETNGAICRRPLELKFDTSKGTGLAVTLELRGTVNVDIDWGDNSSIESVTSSGRTTHSYASAGIYTVKVTGLLTQFGPGVGSIPNIDKLVSVLSFGELGITSFSGAFIEATNLETVPAALPPGVTNMYSMFFGATSFNGDIGGWDVSKVTNMSQMFRDATGFNQDISGWDVGNVTAMSFMFYGTDLFNGDIGGWDVGNVTAMSFMFYRAAGFNQSISEWDVGNVTACNNFNDISGLQCFNTPPRLINLGCVQGCPL